MFERVEVVAILGSVSLLTIVLELIRRKHLRVGYALLWLFTAVALIILSFWRSGLDLLAGLMGIYYPPTALFVVGFGFVLLILLQFSLVVSRLAEENKRLAQRVGLLEWQVRRLSAPQSGMAWPNLHIAHSLQEERRGEGANR
jgi:hypothetical protein